MSSLRGKVVFITGATRGIGKAIGIRAARDGARVVVVGKTVEPHPRLPGTLQSAVEEMRAAGGEALACQADIRFEEQVEAAVRQAVERFGGLDILVNNASAIDLAATMETSMKRFDLMHAVNGRGTFLTSKLCLPHLLKASNPHILNISPPLTTDPKWYGKHLAYTLAKMSMSFSVLGMAAEFAASGVGVNALWPRTVIATAAVQNLLGGPAAMQRARKPEIMADAAHAILIRDGRQCTGNFFIDEEVIRQEGCRDFDQYSVTPGADLLLDFFID